MAFAEQGASWLIQLSTLRCLTRLNSRTLFVTGVASKLRACGEDRIVVLLQFDGASGQGFIGPDRLKQARLALEIDGHFEGGVYRREVTTGRRNWDAYVAG